MDTEENKHAGFLHRLFAKLSNRQFLLIGAVVVGLGAGLSAVLLKTSVHFLQELLRPLAVRYSWIYFVTPAVGIALTGLFVKYFLNGELLKGTAHVMAAIAKQSSFLPRKETFGHLVTSALTVGLGGSAGLESPIVQTGSAIGSNFASAFPIGYRVRTLLLACGAAAGISTAFNAPIAGVLFALEVLLVDVNVTAFIPLLISGAVGALCSKIILSEGILLSFRSITSFNYHNVFYYVLLGIVCGLVSVFYLRAYEKIESVFKRLFPSGLTRFFVGATTLGVLIFIFPALFGEGYASIKSLASANPESLFYGSAFENFFTGNVWILGLAIGLVSLVKVLAVSLTLNSGGNGGNFAPSLLIGACVGFAFSFLGNSSGFMHLPISNFCLVAMAGILTGIFHAPLTAIFLIAEITGGYDLIIPLMIVSALSTAVSKYFNPRSLDEAKLSKTILPVSYGKDQRILSQLSLAGFVERDFIKVNTTSNLGALVKAVGKSKRNIFPVVNEFGNLEGIILLEDIREIMFDTSLYETKLVTQLMRKPSETVDLHEDMDAVMEKFDKSGMWNIPVLSNGLYEGFVSKSQVFTSYRESLRRD